MPAFSGGVRDKDTAGYPRMSAGPQRKKYVHVLVAQGMLGRELLANEHVHHKDGCVDNPHWSNLIVLKDTIHNAVSNRQYHYLKQFLSKEKAAWMAFFDVTGETYAEYETRTKAEAVPF